MVNPTKINCDFAVIAGHCSNLKICVVFHFEFLHTVLSQVGGESVVRKEQSFPIPFQMYLFIQQYCTITSTANLTEVTFD